MQGGDFLFLFCYNTSQSFMFSLIANRSLLHRFQPSLIDTCHWGYLDFCCGYQKKRFLFSGYFDFVAVFNWFELA